MRLYKLTDWQFRTYGKTQWGENITHTASGTGALCGPGWIHAYTDPLLAMFLNPIHARFDRPVLWEAEGEIGLSDYGLKVGCKALTTIRQIPVPVISTMQRVKFAVLCSKAVCLSVQWLRWADGWLLKPDDGLGDSELDEIDLDNPYNFIDGGAAQVAAERYASRARIVASAYCAAHTADAVSWISDRTGMRYVNAAREVENSAANAVACAVIAADDEPLDLIALARQALA